MRTMKAKRPGFEVIYSGPADKVDETEVYMRSFAKFSHAERLMGCWELVERAWQLKGKSLDELRFNRTVAVLKRI